MSAEAANHTRVPASSRPNAQAAPGSDAQAEVQAPKLRVSYVWCDEIMEDQVFAPDEPLILGTGKKATMTIAGIGLGEEFELLRPNGEEYLLTLKPGMAGRLNVGGSSSDIAELVQGGAPRLTPISVRDSAIIDLDGSGTHVVAFHFVAPEQALPPASSWTDTETLLPALAFALILHLAFVVAFFTLHDPQNSLIFPGRAELMTSYLVQRPPPPPPPAEAAEESASEDGDKKNVQSATQGQKGKSGGEGKKPRQRDPNPAEVAPEIETGLLTKESRETIRRATKVNRAMDKRLQRSLARLKGVRQSGGVGSGSGRGTGIGRGIGGTGTTRGGKGRGPGGGGSVQGDFVSQGKVNVGETRRPRGRGGKGRGPKEVALVKTGKATGSLKGLSRAEIEKVIRARQGLIRACYQRQLNRNRGLSGKITVSFRIQSNGSVSSARVVGGQSTLRDRSVQSCVVRQIGKLKFPAKGGGTVNFPFIFNQG